MSSQMSAVFLTAVRYLRLTLLLILGVSGSVHAIPYSIATIDVPGSNDTIIYGVNDSGQIVGYFHDSAGAHGFLLSSGTFTTIDVPDATWTEAFGINDAGVIVGDYWLGGVVRGFKLAGGTFSSIAVPGSSATSAFGINDAGAIVGQYQLGTSQVHGFTLQSGVFATIDVPGAEWTQAYGIDAAGAISGNYQAPGEQRHGFQYELGSFSFFDAPGADSGGTNTYGLNDLGQVVGNFGDDSGSHNFVSSGEAFVSFELPGALCNRAFDISNSGQVVGAYGNCSSPGWHGFIATPIAEPTSFALLGLGLAGLGFSRRKQ